jgi:hypothetical protein
MPAPFPTHRMTKLDPKFLALLADTAQKLQALESSPACLMKPRLR